MLVKIARPTSMIPVTRISRKIVMNAVSTTAAPRSGFRSGATDDSFIDRSGLSRIEVQAVEERLEQRHDGIELRLDVHGHGGATGDVHRPDPTRFVLWVRQATSLAVGNRGPGRVDPLDRDVRDLDRRGDGLRLDRLEDPGAITESRDARCDLGFLSRGCVAGTFAGARPYRRVGTHHASELDHAEEQQEEERRYDRELHQGRAAFRRDRPPSRSGPFHLRIGSLSRDSRYSESAEWAD